MLPEPRMVPTSVSVMHWHWSTNAWRRAGALERVVMVRLEVSVPESTTRPVHTHTHAHAHVCPNVSRLRWVTPARRMHFVEHKIT